MDKIEQETVELLRDLGTDPYAIFVDDELKPIPEAPGQGAQMPASMRADIQEGSAAALLKLVEQAARDDITVVSYWNPKVAQEAIEKATEKPVVVILDILNERQSASASISRDQRCGLVLAEQVFAKWPTVPIIFLTQFDSRHPERGRVSKITSRREFITKGTDHTIQLLHDCVDGIFSAFRSRRGVLETGRLRFEILSRRVFWRGFELGTIATAREWREYLSEDLDLRESTNLTARERTFLEYLMRRAIECWESNPPKPARVTATELQDDLDLTDDMIRKNVKQIRDSLENAETQLFRGNPQDAFNVLKNERYAYVFTDVLKP